jgi:hypothetical protein
MQKIAGKAITRMAVLRPDPPYANFVRRTKRSTPLVGRLRLKEVSSKYALIEGLEDSRPREVL